MEYILSFRNTDSAIRAERCLLGHGVDVGVLPLPSQIKAGCGICLRVGDGAVDFALKALEGENIRDVGLFSRIGEIGRYSYAREYS